MNTAAQALKQRVFKSRIGLDTHVGPVGPLLDADIVSELSAMLAECAELGGTRVVVDLSDVPQVNSAAIEALLDAQDQLLRAGGRLKVVGAGALVWEVLRITGFTNSVPSTPKDQADAGPAADPDRKQGPQPLGEILVRREVLSREKVDEALRIQGKTGQRLGEIISEREWAGERELLNALGEQLGVPVLRLRAGVFDPDVVSLLGHETARRLRVLPLFLVRGVLTLATSNPQDVPTLAEVEERLRCVVRPVLCLPAEIISGIGDGHVDDDATLGLIGDIDEDFEVVDNLLPNDYSTIDEMAAGSPVINFVNSLIQRAIRDGASDIHIEPSRKKARIRFRIDGVLYEVMSPRIELHPAVVSRLKVMANLDIAERRMPQDGRVQVFTQQRAVDLRFSSLPGLFGEKVVLRVLDKNRAILDVNKLGFSPGNLQAYLDLLRHSTGLILVTGPTGSGKTTSLYAALNHLNSLEKNIVTIEDPVEYQIDIINQNEVRENIGLGFAKVLKHVLRQDPDIVMVGEIRERETASIAVQAALTGHLVLSTLHTNDSAGAVSRMIDMGVEPYLLASSLIGVVAQRLVRTVCQSCKASSLAPPEVLKRFGWEGDKVMLTRGRGCPDCYDSGYRGRIAIHEVLTVDPDLERLIIASPSRDRLADYLKEKGVRTIFHDGLDRVRAGQTTIEEVSRVVTAA